MNNMPKQGTVSNLNALRLLSMSVGQFIRYWGFRRIHGAIWTQIYLSPRPLSCTDLATRLKLSKSLVSPALGELEEYGLILPAESENDKTKRYTADEDVSAVIRRVLKQREQKMINNVAKQVAELKKNRLSNDEIDPKRLTQLADMTDSAQLMLSLLVDTEDLMNLPNMCEIHADAL